MKDKLKTHCRISFDGGKTWHWATCRTVNGWCASPHRVYMPFGKVLVEKLYQLWGSYSVKNYQNRKKPLPVAA